MMRFFVGMLARDVMILCRRPAVWLLPLAFFLMTPALFSIASADSPAAMREVALGVIWSSALLAALLAQDGIFRHDGENGFIEQALLSARPLPLFALAKAAAHWLLTGLPLTLAAPAVALILNFPPAGLPMLLLTLPLGAAALSLLGAFVAALTYGQKNTLLAALLALPLSVPVLIFAVAAVSLALGKASAAAPLSLLAALATLALTLLPLATSGVLRAIGGRG